MDLATEVRTQFGTSHERTWLLLAQLAEAFRSSQRSDAITASFASWRRTFEQVATAARRGTSSRRLESRTLSAGVRRLGWPNAAENLEPFLFIVQTYYAFVARLLAHRILEPDKRTSRRLDRLFASSDDEFVASLAGLGEPVRDHPPTLAESSHRATRLGAEFDWFLQARPATWVSLARQCVAQAAALALERIETTAVVSATANTFPAEATPDLLAGLYQELVPGPLRKLLGEFYTPAWLARHVLELARSSRLADPQSRWLDPTCGSGVFLALAIRDVRCHPAARDVDRPALRHAILSNIVGIDLNPLAALAARTNYLAALGPLVHEGEPESLQIPILHGDSIQGTDPTGQPLPPLGEFDFIVGNPPWLGWEELPVADRQQTRALWERHGLFPQRGLETILGAGKKDLSLLVTYVAADRYAKLGGRIALVITQAAFKMAGAAKGFRRFAMADGTPIGCERVDDFSRIDVFQGAATKTATMVLEKGRPQRYPVPYFVWDQQPGGAGLPERVREWVAVPSDGRSEASAWLTLPAHVLQAIRKILGPSPYKARQGVNSGGANAVYWFELVGDHGDGTATVRNIVQSAKRKVEQEEVRIERTLLYPLLRHRDIGAENSVPWRAEPTGYLLFTQDVATRRGLSLANMVAYPLTLAWLARHEQLLRQRAAYSRYFDSERDPFWSMFDVGAYAFAPWKVVWPRMARRLTAAVVGVQDAKPILPQETISYIPLDDEREAYYVAGVMNCTPFRLAVSCFSEPASKSFGTPGILTKARLPQFDATSPRHARIADEATRRTRLASAADRSEARPELRDPRGDSLDLLDTLCAPLWNLTPDELESIREAVAAVG